MNYLLVFSISIFLGYLFDLISGELLDIYKKDHPEEFQDEDYNKLVEGLPSSKIGVFLVGVLYTVIYSKMGITLNSIPHYLLATALGFSTIMDLKEMIVLDSVHVIGVILIVISRIAILTDIKYFIISSIGMLGVLLLVFLLSKGQFGGADVKIYALIGLVLGFLKALDSLFLASLSGSLFGVSTVLRGKSIKECRIPFIPFIMIGVILSYYINFYG